MPCITSTQRTKLVRLCLVVLDFEAARWQLPESIRTKHAPIVTHYQQIVNNLQVHRCVISFFTASSV
jgi:hypothetical protein